MKHTHLFAPLLLAATILAGSCSKKTIAPDGDEPDTLATEIHTIGSSKDQPGLGESDEDPRGTPLTLPQGIRLVQRPYQPFNPDPGLLYGHSNDFYADINLVNDNMPGTPPVTVTFPPGLVLISMDHDKQNGLSLSRIVIEVPPTLTVGGGRDTTTIYIGASCINKSRSMPWYDNDLDEYNYPLARNNFNRFLITTDPNLLKLVDILKDKVKLRPTRHWSPLEAHEPDYVVPEWLHIYEKIGEMVWAITDGYGISSDDLAEFKQELNAYK